MGDIKVPKRIATMIMNALQGGVVPRTGLGYIAVGRDDEISALLKDIEIIEDGGATFRFVTGDYGSGKTFLLQTIKEHAVQKGFVVADADLSPERALIGTNVNKRGLATYRELMTNMSMKTSPTGGALEKILDNWMDSVWVDVAKDFASGLSGSDMIGMVSERISSCIYDMQDKVNGFDFANVLTIYWKAKQAGDRETKSKALRWLRGEYRTKRDAQLELGISSIINDGDWFDYVKIFSELFVKIGYKGFIIMIDEMINIYKYRQSVSRQRNYEYMLNMYNDALQGKAQYLGIIMGGTPISVEDPYRGVFSYAALRSRLESGRFKNVNVINLMTPIIKIKPLSKSDIIVLLEKLAQIHSDLYGYEGSISEKELIMFVDVIIGGKNVTPRSIIRDFINILDIIYQNQGSTIESILKGYVYGEDLEPDWEEIED